MPKLNVVLITLLIIASLSPAYAGKVGEQVNDSGQKIILHEVEKGQTLFALSRLYNTPVDDILDANPGMGTSLNIGQVVKVPVPGEEDKPNTAPKEETKLKESSKPASKTKTKEAYTHTVEAGETLYSISKLHKVEVAQLKAWNELEHTALKVGMELKVGEKPKEVMAKVHTVERGETLYAIARKYGAKVEDIRNWNGLESYEVKVGSKLAVSKPNTDIAHASKIKSHKDKFTVEYENGKVVEKGMADVIGQKSGTQKHLCLHRSAPKGSILQVKNEQNGSVVFVRVVGKLPETGNNSNLLIRLSDVAYSKLGPNNERFPVEVMYIP